MNRSNKPEVRNPVVALPEVALMHKLPDEARLALRAVVASFAETAKVQERNALKRGKAPLYYYWHVVNVYAKHIAHAIGKAPRRKAMPVKAGLREEFDRAVEQLRRCREQDEALPRMKAAIDEVLATHAGLVRYERCEAAVTQERLDKAMTSLTAVAESEFYEGRADAVEECMAEACFAYRQVKTVHGQVGP